ncbi:hypothetical protein FKG96_12375 [Olivibacter sp. LS-1]|uniref:hypothetical protein n=1 Tax=Olivibacter sp. LS-1 TaxID=2592345 RepID=UPI0011EAB069|nr:hypothetical protein [Olivibacter sp. LS-1]QEL01568.1 hypothetical protein FKG96_12375 [Olivibacter sp. LS-1]
MLKATIIKKIKEKCKSEGINLSNVRINGLADKIDARVDNEDDIDGEIDNLDAVISFRELAALDDAKRNADKLAAEKKDRESKDNGNDADEDDDKPSDKDKTKPKADEDMPSWAKSLIESNNALKAELTTLKAGGLAQTRRQQLEGKLKDAPEKFKARILRDFDRLKIDSDEDFTNYLADIEQDVADEIQAQADAGLGDQPVSGIGTVKKLKDDEVSSEMKELLAERKQATEATKTTA